MKARLRFKIIAYSLLLVILLALVIWFWQYNSAQARDYTRLADLKVAQAQLSDYYLKFNTFIIPYCQTPLTLSDCQGKDRQKISLSDLVDPLNTGSYRYDLVYLGEDNFQINFALEIGAGGLKAGAYKMTKVGVSQ